MVNRIDINSSMQAEFNVRAALAIDPYTQVLPIWIDGFQVGEGAFRIEHQEVAFPGMEIAYFVTENTFSDRYVIPTGETHFAFALSPHIPVVSWSGYKDGMVNAITIHRSDIEYTSVMPPNWSGIYICLNNHLLATHDLLPEKFWENCRDPNRGILQVEPILFSRFRQFIQTWFARVRDLHSRRLLIPDYAIILREELLWEFRELLDRTFAERGDRSSFKPSRRYWIFESVNAMLEANLTKNLTTEEFCQQLAVSPRSLQYAFKEIAGVGVQQYIRARKLNAVREALLRHDPKQTTVNAIALYYGFSHPSRFSQQFYRLFGEYPSTIIRHKCHLD